MVLFTGFYWAGVKEKKNNKQTEAFNKKKNKLSNFRSFLLHWKE